MASVAAAVLAAWSAGADGFELREDGLLLSAAALHSSEGHEQVLAALDHPFVVGLHCAFQTEHHLCLVMDFVEGGNMYSDLLDGPYPLARAAFSSVKAPRSPQEKKRQSSAEYGRPSCRAACWARSLFLKATKKSACPGGASSFMPNWVTLCKGL